ncbi:sensor domain-containing protein [Marinicella gelatinilytica]|uniref:sensor domain-containing protein n=1 Tax=Marinicella gelatinilytica TaxID=2996017 RepID=UPI002260E672|nr:bifunctional diguanylate cyclase/phosphodiesterase [Marinicella gelatinilytica]MCX7545338.1 EAL domain-containing protein [Marinicella gelatinilytica]
MTSGTFDNLLHRFVLNDSLHQLFDAVNAISVQGYDEQRRVIYWNKGSERLYGYSKEEAEGQKLEDLIIPDEIRDIVIKGHNAWLKTGKEIPASEITLRHKSGKKVFVFSSHVLFVNQYGVRQMYCIDIDLKDLRQAQAQANFKEHMLESIFDAIPDLFFLMKSDGTVIDYYSSNTGDFFSKSNDFMGKNISTLFADVKVNGFQKQMESALKHKSNTRFEYEYNVHQIPKHFEARVRFIKEYDQVMVIIRDISEQHKAAELIRHQAYYDNLTSLPNRFLSLEQLSQLLKETQRSNEKIAVLFLDLDDFKKINDSLGHEVGDKLLIKCVKRLKSAIRKQDLIGRLGGDEFIVLLKGYKTHKAITHATESLLKAFRTPFNLDGRELILTVSIGIAISPDDGDSASDLLRNADIAMYQAKELGRNTYSFFTKEMNVFMQRRSELEAQMHGALERQEFEVYYQPQIDVKKRKVIGAEALIRWNNPTLGNILPDEFIPVAEQTGLIVSIGELVIRQAVRFLSEWEKEHNVPFNMAVNLSPRQFRDEGLFTFIRDQLKLLNVAPDQLELEITEGLLLSGKSYIKETLNKINKLGIKLAMDDFGTGYSSLGYLREFSFDVLKMDRAFVQGITTNKSDYDLVKATIAMSRSLDLLVVAEGVETKAQLQMLEDLGCDIVQGFYFSKPLSKQAFFGFIKSFCYDK